MIERFQQVCLVIDDVIIESKVRQFKRRIDQSLAVQLA